MSSVTDRPTAVHSGLLTDYASETLAKVADQLAWLNDGQDNQLGDNYPGAGWQADPEGPTCFEVNPLPCLDDDDFHYRPTSPPDFIPTDLQDLERLGYELGYSNLPCPSIIDPAYDGPQHVAISAAHDAGKWARYDHDNQEWCEAQIRWTRREIEEREREERLRDEDTQNQDTQNQDATIDFSEMVEAIGVIEARKIGGEA